MSEQPGAPYRMQVRYRSPFPVGVLEWNAPSPVVTIVVAASFHMMADGAAAVADRQEALGADQPFAGVEGELYRATDFVPGKGAVDVLVVGHARSPQPATTIPIALSIGQRRVSWAAVSPRATQAIPLLTTHLRSSSHPGAGPVRLAPSPIAQRDWRSHVRASPFDFSAFNAAPPEHRLAELELGAPMVLEGLIAGTRLRFVELPTRMPFVFVAHRANARLGEDIERVPMVCDTLWIDVDRCIFTLTWRGTTARRGAFGPEPAVLLLDGHAGRPPDMSEVLALVDGAPSYLAATERTAAPRPPALLDSRASARAAFLPARESKTEVLDVEELGPDASRLDPSKRPTRARESTGTMPPTTRTPPLGPPFRAARPAAEGPFPGVTAVRDAATPSAAATTGGARLPRPTLVLTDETDDEEATLHQQAETADADEPDVPGTALGSPSYPDRDEAEEPAPTTARVGLRLGSHDGFALGRSTLDPTQSVAPLPFAPPSEPRVGASEILTPDQPRDTPAAPPLPSPETGSPSNEPRGLPLEPVAMPLRPPGAPDLPGASHRFDEHTRTEAAVPLAEPLPFARAPAATRSALRSAVATPSATRLSDHGGGPWSADSSKPRRRSQGTMPPPPRAAPSVPRGEEPTEAARRIRHAPFVADLPLETYAAVKAELAACGPDSAPDAVLLRHALDWEAWRIIERRQARALARDASEGRGALAARVRGAVAAARRALALASIPAPRLDLERYATLRVALEHADRRASDQLLQDEGLTQQAWERMHRMWAHRARTDRRTAAKLRQAIERAEHERQDA